MKRVINEDFPYVDVPENYRAIVGERDSGTRCYHAYGPAEDFRRWSWAVGRVCGRTISPGGVVMYVRCTRAGVHKRIQEGRLTAFCFHVVKGKTAFRGREILDNGGRPYIDIPLSECEAWGKMLGRQFGRWEGSEEASDDYDFCDRYPRAKSAKAPRRTYSVKSKRMSN